MQLFSCESGEYFENSFFGEHLRTTANLENCFEKNPPSVTFNVKKIAEVGTYMPISTLCKGEGALLKLFKSEGNSQTFYPPLWF